MSQSDGDRHRRCHEFTELYGAGMYGSFFEDQIVNSDVIL